MAVSISGTAFFVIPLHRHSEIIVPLRLRNEWRCVVLECIDLTAAGRSPQPAKVCVSARAMSGHSHTSPRTKLLHIMKNYEVIDKFFAAQVACNESEETLKALRPQVEEAVQALIAERGLGKSFTGTIEYHGIKIVVSRPKSYTWEKNTNPAITSDPNHAIYVQQLALLEQIAAQLKDMRADVKRTAEKLAKAHPDSDSIKHSFRIAFA